MFTDIVIMAGGSGTRLWPASNSRVPKQFLSLGDGSTFFGAALERAFAVAKSGGSVVVVAGAAHVPHAVKAASARPPAERDRVVVIPEPAGRNTAPAVACAAVFLSRRYGAGAGRRALVLTSDHVIGPMDAFRADAEAADALASGDALAADGRLVVFGIPPTRPETGFGYIEAGAPLPSAAAPGRTFAVASFREKPDRATAEGFLETGRFTWNSGMFGFGVDFMLSQFRALAPETLAPFDPLPTPAEAAYERREGVAVLSGWAGLAEAYGRVKPISIDYAVAEKCRSVALVAAGFDWLDVGSWDEYARFQESGRIRAGAAQSRGAPVYAAGSANCFVDADLPVALCGVEDLIVAVRSGADGSPPSVLICRRGESQKVKEIVDAVKASGRTDLL
jgi:mannose-1-phosphate guanylyltransferase/mannose-1-phosphate guanylyltransferase/mannose-6-phosphate isomerase